MALELIFPHLLLRGWGSRSRVGTRSQAPPVALTQGSLKSFKNLPVGLVLHHTYPSAGLGATSCECRPPWTLGPVAPPFLGRTSSLIHHNPHLQLPLQPPGQPCGSESWSPLTCTHGWEEGVGGWRGDVRCIQTISFERKCHFHKYSIWRLPTHTLRVTVLSPGCTFEWLRELENIQVPESHSRGCVLIGVGCSRVQAFLNLTRWFYKHEAKIENHCFGEQVYVL